MQLRLSLLRSFTCRAVFDRWKSLVLWGKSAASCLHWTTSLTLWQPSTLLFILARRKASIAVDSREPLSNAGGKEISFHLLEPDVWMGQLFGAQPPHPGLLGSHWFSGGNLLHLVCIGLLHWRCGSHQLCCSSLQDARLVLQWTAGSLWAMQVEKREKYIYIYACIYIYMYIYIYIYVYIYIYRHELHYIYIYAYISDICIRIAQKQVSCFSWFFPTHPEHIHEVNQNFEHLSREMAGVSDIVGRTQQEGQGSKNGFKKPFGQLVSCWYPLVMTNIAMV